MLQTHYQVQFIESILFESLGEEAVLKDFQFLYCGNFNLAARVETKTGKYFIKWNKGDHEGMFESEAKSMELIRETNTVHVPKVYGYGKKPDGSYLMLDFVAESSKKSDYWQDFGRKLAALHAHSHENFGLHFNNYVGALPQINDYSKDGIQFFIEKRLNYQVERAVQENKIDSKLANDFQKLNLLLPNILPNEKPALLHGDLWSGNLMVGSTGHASLVDPSAYYGFREADIAFTTLFGGFPIDFYEAYNEVKHLEPGFKNRIDLYNLYPLMVHTNLFGGSYLESVKRIIAKYV
ncbi:MAG: fructosamine kinase family protein [Bacteroidota bacterium]